MYVLVVEDHHDVADVLRMGLEECGYRVDVARDGVEGERLALANDYGLLVVDWMLPGQDGTTLIQHLRQKDVDVPALMLTARAEKHDQVEALDLGADDYLAKPFSFDVLLARLRALSRRVRRGDSVDLTSSPILEIGPLRINHRERRAALADQPLPLRTKEYELLVLFANEANHVLTRTTIVERVWGDLFTSDDVLNTTIGSLRRKLRTAADRSASPIRIETLRGVGYRLCVPTRSAQAAA